jgi:1,4-alpha-glucan branching enzyme
VAWLIEQHGSVKGARGRALDQAIRELLLLQSSDWGFIMTTRTVAPYAWARIRAHVHRLRHLGYLVQKANLEPTDIALIDDIAGRDNFLHELSGPSLRSPFD